MIKKLLINCLIILLILNLTVTPVSALTENDISAQAAVLMDQSSGRVFFAKDEHKRLPMASTTKIMTALLALESGNLNSRVVVSERASLVEGSSIWLEKGEAKTLEELLYGLMLRSGNDAATAIAEHIGGSLEDFSVMMTERAREIGAYNTHFKNPHGLPDENHFTTAYDFGLIACQALNIPKFREIITTREKRITWPEHQWDRFLRNQNRLLELYPGGDGVKTGWTSAAGRCFVGSATRDSWQLVAVVLNAPDMWEDSKVLLDYGFTNWTPRQLISKGQFIKTELVKGGLKDKVTLVTAAEFIFPLKKGEEELIDYDIKVENKAALEAPISKNEKIGELVINFTGEEMKSIDLLAGESIGKKSIFITFKNWFKKWLQYIV